jgi:hypothetical protein
MLRTPHQVAPLHKNRNNNPQAGIGAHCMRERSKVEKSDRYFSEFSHLLFEFYLQLTLTLPAADHQNDDPPLS